MTDIFFDIIARDKASRVFRGVGDEATKTSSKMQTFHKVGTAAGVALAGGLVLAGKAAVAFTKKAADDQASASKMAQTYVEAAGATKQQISATEDWITAQGKSKGVTDDELRPALAKLVVATHDVSQAQSLAALAMDVSAGTGKSLESVSLALAKAQNGNTAGLGRLGVATKDAAGNTLSLDQITRNLAATYTGAAATAAETTAGKQKILTTQMGELQEKIGYELLPVMTKLVAVGTTVVNWISNNTKVAGVIVGVLGSLVAVTWAVSAATKAWLAITKVAAAAQWLLNAALDANPIGLVVIALVALAAGLVYAYKHSKTFRNIVNAAFGAVKKVAMSVAGFFTHQVPAAFAKVSAAAGKVLSWVKGHWPLLLAVLTGPFGLAVLVIAKNWGKIKDGAVAAVSFIKGKLGDLLSFVRDIPGKIGDLEGKFLAAGVSLGRAILNGMINGLKSAAAFMGGLITSIKSAINSALSLPLEVNIDKGPFHLHQTVIPAFANGVRDFAGGLALVGERGPEIVGLPRGSNVYPNGTGPAMGGGGDTALLMEIRNLLQQGQVVSVRIGDEEIIRAILRRNKRKGVKTAGL